MKCAIIKQMLVVASALSLLGAAQALASEGCVFLLTEAQRLLSERNRDVLAARRAVESAQADRLTAAVTPPPVLSFNTSNINPKTGLGGGPLPDKRIDSVLRLDKTFERGGKRERRIEAAEAGITAARADADDSQRQQRLALAGAYYDLKLAQEGLRLARENVASYEESQRATELRLKAGDISMIEAQRLRVEQLRASNDLTQAQAQLKRAQLGLASLLAQEDRAAQLCAGDAWPEQTPEFDASASEIVERRADVRAAAARVRQAEAAFQLARAQAKADVTLGAQYERFPPDGRELLGFGFSLPLFVGERQEGAIRRANVERINAEASLERTRALAGSDVAAALNDYRSAVERLQRYRTELLPTAEKTAQAAEFARRQGALSLIDLLDARRTLRAVRLDGEQARADVAKAQAALTELTKPQESELP